MKAINEDNQSSFYPKLRPRCVLKWVDILSLQKFPEIIQSSLALEHHPGTKHRAQQLLGHAHSHQGGPP